jgi:hypothetical protein
MKQTTRFSHSNGALMDVVARSGKQGISVFARVRQAGQRTVNGCRSVFLEKNEADATTMFDKLTADAVKKGWTLKAANVGVQRFTEIPAPTALPTSVPKTTRPAAAKKGKK